MTWLGTITLAQIDSLEPIFAVFGPSGWVIPAWLVELRASVVERDETRVSDSLHVPKSSAPRLVDWADANLPDEPDADFIDFDD